MKKLYLLLIFALGVSISSCKKYDKCCYFKAHDQTNNIPKETKTCRSNLSKKELEEFEANNSALNNYNNAKSAGSVYFKDPQYYCE